MACCGSADLLGYPGLGDFPWRHNTAISTQQARKAAAMGADSIELPLQTAPAGGSRDRPWKAPARQGDQKAEAQTRLFRAREVPIKSRPDQVSCIALAF